MKRVFLIVLDSCGVGELPDAADFGDLGSFTLRSAATDPSFSMPNMEKLGLFHIDGVYGAVNAKGLGKTTRKTFKGSVCKLAERSKGKDTTTGHWEISGIVSESPMPTFPDGFPKELIDELSKRTGRGILCNKPYSGTDVIRDYGKQQLATGDLIVYTSADSVLQIAAHDQLIPTGQLYEYCKIAREICQGEWGVGRVIARPFTGEWPYTRTALRHDYSLVPPPTMLNVLSEAGYAVHSVGKIIDIFAESGITEYVRTQNNAEGIERTLEEMDKDFEGLCFTNLVDFDMQYGHRNDVPGYAKALTYFDSKLPEMLSKLRDEDVLMVTADHGCDPATPSTDHSREYIPLVAFGKPVAAGKNFGTRQCFADIAQTILAYFGVKNGLAGEKIEGILK
ncbi:MAG: phosphopentomutase [Lachnospiraceae bacterium]|nr:phosphopentomutase [Lachnospiraceae bacterium]